ncbi:efflux RND transporter periplasmic adaptor subunit [Chitinibacteraceae bacterium HSL-7]
MKLKPIMAGLVAGGVVLAALGAGYWLGSRAMDHGAMAPAATADGAATQDPSGWTVAEGEAASRRHIENGIKAGMVDSVTGRKVLYYHDPMSPGKQFEAPGKSPFMDMMLVPVYEGASKDAGTVEISPRIQQNLGVRVGVVERAPLAGSVSATGAIAYNERAQSVLSARSMGFVEKLYVRAALDSVRAGQPIADLYVPEWVAMQQDYFAVRDLPDSEGLRRAAMARMKQAGMSDGQVAAVVKGGKVISRFALVAPHDGVLAALDMKEGMTVMAGMPLARVARLDTVWAEAEVPEAQASGLRPGAVVAASSNAWPGVTFSGTVQSLLPEVNPATRTRKARVELANTGLKLVPGMVVAMQLGGGAAESVLQVPAEAVIRTGRRSVVMVKDGDGSFAPVTVKTGEERDGRIAVLEGLQEGQSIVLSGQFMIDSEASLKGVEARMSPAKPAVAPGVITEATVEAVNGRAVTLTHPEIPELGWPGMTMDFRLADGVDAAHFKKGGTVKVRFTPSDEDVPLIDAVLAGGQS